MDTRPIRKPDTDRHDEVVIIGRAMNPKYDYSSRIHKAFEQGREDWLEQIQLSLFNDLRYSEDADRSLIGMQINLSQKYIDKIRRYKEMTTEEKIAIAKATMAGTHIDHLNQFFGDGQTLNFYPKDKEDAKVVDITEFEKGDTRNVEEAAKERMVTKAIKMFAKEIPNSRRYKWGFAYQAMVRKGIIDRSTDTRDFARTVNRITGISDETVRKPGSSYVFDRKDSDAIEELVAMIDNLEL